MARNSRELVSDFFKGDAFEKPLFFPWVCSFAAKLEQITENTMLSDPGVLFRALSNAHKLFGYDVILNHFDPTLEAEACGCTIEWKNDNRLPTITNHPLEDGTDFYDLDTEGIEKKGRIPIILEATKRLILTKGKEVPIAAMITGPLTLAKYLRGSEFTEQLEAEDGEAMGLIEDAGSICLKLCRTYCEAGVDIIVIAENTQDLVIQDLSPVLASPLKSIFNVARFFNVNSILISKVSNDQQAVSICSLGADAVSITGKIDIDHVRGTTREKNYRMSTTIPDSVFTKNATEIGDLLGQSAYFDKSGFFLTSEWELPRDTNVDTMHAIMHSIRGI